MYGKHFASMYTGSMVGSGAVVFAVWGYVVANVRFTDSSVELNPRILATILGEPVEEIEKAITVLCSPDKHSRSQEEEGRRLVLEGPFLYRVVNAKKYGSIRDEDGRREYMREYMKKRRSKQDVNSVNSGKPPLANVDVDVDVKEDVDVDKEKDLLPARYARVRTKPNIAKQRNSVAVIDFRELWSEARKDSHYGTPWVIPKGSAQEKQLLAVAKAIQEQYPKCTDQTFYATCERYFASEDPFIVSTKHCLNLFCSRFNQFLVFMPKVEISPDGSTIVKAGYTGSGKWVEPKVLIGTN
jgi:hypothetical protein